MNEITCLALLAADRVWKEDNGKLGMVGIFDSFTLERFPTQVAPFFLYVRLGNVPKGKNEININIVSGVSKLSIANMKIELDVQVDRSIVQLPIPLPMLPLPVPGAYVVNLIVNDNLISNYILNANLNIVRA